MRSDLPGLTPAHELARRIRAREVSPVELTEEVLRAIERLNPILNAFLTVDGDAALAAAAAAAKALASGQELGPLHGVPIPVKDLNATGGLRTTFGSLAYRDHIPSQDDLVVERLRAAGAIIVGKTNTSEFGQSATTENRLRDDCRNPWDPSRTSGGSSGGAAAAVAAGIVPLAQGSDGGGSIRIPASFCGVFGIKPSQGRVPSAEAAGGMPLFSQAGPLARTVRDAALLLNVLSGPDERDPACLREAPPDFLAGSERPLDASPPLRIASSVDLGYAAVDPEVIEVTSAAARVFAEMGHDVDEATPELEDPYAIFGPIVIADGFAAHGDLLADHADELMPYVRATLERGRDLPAHRYSSALRALERFRAQLRRFFEAYDLLLTPTTAVPAFPVGQRPVEIAGVPVSSLWGAFPLTAPINLSGHPAASLPCGRSAQGLPIGLHIIGRFGDEVTVLRAAAAFELARPWAAELPVLG